MAGPRHVGRPRRHEGHQVKTNVLFDISLSQDDPTLTLQGLFALAREQRALLSKRVSQGMFLADQASWEARSWAAALRQQVFTHTGVSGQPSLESLFQVDLNFCLRMFPRTPLFQKGISIQGFCLRRSPDPSGARCQFSVVASRVTLIRWSFLFRRFSL